MQLLKEDAERHSVAQGAGGGILNDDAVCHRIAEGNADIHSVLFECTDYIGCAVERGEAGTKVDRQQVFGAVLEELVDTIHSEFVITDLLMTVTLSAGRRLCRQPAVSPVLIAWRNFPMRSTSLFPGAVSKRLLMSMPASLG